MRVTINADGRLTIRAENGIESFALAAWFEKSMKGEVVWEIDTRVSGDTVLAADLRDYEGD